MARGLRIASLVLLLIVLLFTLSSSALSNPYPQPPPPPTEVRLSTEDDGRHVELKEGQLLVITLEANPSTGYIWEVEGLDEKVLRQVGDIEFEQESNLLGAPGRQAIRFQGAGEGQTALKLVYRRPWEKDVAPAKTFSLQVQAVGPFTGLDSSPTIFDTPAAATLKSSPGSPLPVADQPELGLPGSFNWCDGGYCTGVRDQAACGSCWAFGTVGPFESKILIHDALTKDLSEQHLLSCNTDDWTCDGGWWAHDYHLNKIPPGQSDAGAVYEADFPYVASQVACIPSLDHHEKIDSWAFVGPEYGTPSAADIRQAIYDHGPVSVAVCVGDSFTGYTTGVFETDEWWACPLYDVNHAVVLVGWNDTDGAWILRNSWGTGWGESGYMRIGYGVSNVGYSANYILYNELPNKVYLPLTLKNYPPSAGWATIIGEDFEGSFPGSWTVGDNEPGHGEYYWGKRDCRPYQGGYSGWGVGGGADGAALACGNNYPDYTEGWMVYGPFSLADVTAADLQFKLWLNTEATYDGVCRLASTNGTNFSGYCTTGNSGGWIDRVLDLSEVYGLGDLTGQPNVWVALIFDSDYIYYYPEGGYVDNIVLRKYVAAGMPVPAISGVETIPEGAEIVETPATFIRQP